MTLKECIEEIVVTFNVDDYFDSHVIINELIKNPKYHIVYLQECSTNVNINQYHGKIGKIIASIESVTSVGKSKSHTIYGNISENELWQKTK
ncbi:hypothetical protein [Treponema pedis]|uniref:hypothetical protein n=1 Tax=Treponema pedis TaxID=409322 RepID=UPI000493D5F5|nr:hypothetical protein [Treponema pedis]